eukprot:TRINITY_DN4769_c0_g1_i2.p1 TRINITY_DN4769_c0_g1~~TRINITY_DN4769_c0_g1_i2.p1  ORF type:complete len:848 (+),score=226.97 TRINITY_DN4769_c0_g1_i2:245-2545(+)
MGPPPVAGVPAGVGRAPMPPVGPPPVVGPPTSIVGRVAPQPPTGRGGPPMGKAPIPLMPAGLPPSANFTAVHAPPRFAAPVVPLGVGRGQAPIPPHMSMPAMPPLPQPAPGVRPPSPHPPMMLRPVSSPTLTHALPPAAVLHSAPLQHPAAAAPVPPAVTQPATPKKPAVTQKPQATPERRLVDLTHTKLSTQAMCVPAITKALYARNMCDRSTWVSDFMQSNPDICELRERIYPLQRAICLCKLYHPGKKEVKENISRTHMIQLILQHLQLKGLKESRKVLETESRIKMPRHHMHQSRLVGYLKQAVRDSEGVFDFTIADKVMDKTSLEEHLFLIGLQEEEEEQEDVNIWLEPEGNLIVDKVSNPSGEDEEAVKCGSFNKLVEHLTDESKLDMQYLKTFLMTYQSFTTPEKLLQKLIQRFNVPSNFKGGDNGSQVAGVIRLRVCNVVKKWIEEYSSDFDDNLIVQLKQFIEHAGTFGGHLAMTMQKPLQKMLQETKQKKVVKKFSEATPEPFIPRNIFSKALSLLDIDDEEIARQLTLIEFEIYERIRPSELLNQSWSKPKLKHRSPNVLALIKRFNEVSQWVAEEILGQASIKDRVRVISKFVKVCEKVVALHNFNTLMAFIAGFSFSSVHRLKYSFEEVSANLQKTKSEHEGLMKSDGSFKVYRTALHNLDPPCLPYLGVHLTDLTFVDENPDIINGLNNFAKRNLIFQTISLVQQYQQRSYNLQPVYQIQQYLRQPHTKDEAELYKISLKREPRGASRQDIL